MLAAALALAAALGAPPEKPEKAPYWPPRVAQVTDKLKCDYATVLVVSADKGEMKGTTPAGVVTYKVGAGVPLFDPAGKALTGLAALKSGQKVRVYYLVDDGAKVQEVDQE